MRVEPLHLVEVVVRIHELGPRRAYLAHHHRPWEPE